MCHKQVTTLRQQTAANVMDICWSRFDENLLAAGDFLWDTRTQVRQQDFVDVLVMFTKTCTGAFVLTARRDGLYIRVLLFVLQGSEPSSWIILFCVPQSTPNTLMVGMCAPHGVVVTTICNVPDLSVSGPCSRMESTGW